MPLSLQRRAFLAALAATVVRPGAAHAAPATGESRSDMAEQLAGYVDSVHYTDLSPAVVELARSHFIDAIGCAIAAFNEAPVRAVRDVALTVPGGVATILGTNRRTTLEWATFANGGAIRHFDLNDVYAGRETGHPSDNIAPCLAVAEAEGRSGQELILAIVLAYEIDCRLLDTVRISARGWDHPNFSLPAAALAAGKLMRLPPPQLAEAVNLAIAGHLAPNQTRVQVMSNWKGLADADAARNAVFAAQLARGGITGPAPIFEGDAGFFKQVSGPFTLDIDQFGGRSGSFRLAACSIKFYPAQAHTQTAILAAVKIAHEIGDLGRIQSIAVDTTQPGFAYTAGEPAKWAPETSETADHSLPYIVVRAMLDGEITVHSYTPEALHDPRALALMKTLTVKEDPALTRLYPQKIPNRVTVTLEDGRVLSEQVDELPGLPGRPMTRDDVEAKFRMGVKGIWGEQQTRDFLDYAWNLDQAREVSGLSRHMVVGG
ncbi:MAG: MmgE/PrpD family protein [Acetobacteraceae bacterium]|nr:MmgE/PrpD family protein [Acetobacteraceae bacterium]